MAAKILYVTTIIIFGVLIYILYMNMNIYTGVLKMSHCLIITYKYQFDDVTSTHSLNDKKNQTDSVLFGDISSVQEIEFDINGEEYQYNNGKKNIEKSDEYVGFKVFIDCEQIENEEIMERKLHQFECQYEGFDLQRIKYQKKDFDSYVFRCKNKYAIRYWIDLIQDCIIRAKYYNYKNLKNNTFKLLSFNNNDNNYDMIKEREIKYYRLLLGLPHNQKIAILWEKLGTAISMKQEKDINTFNSCCNAFETAHCLNKQDSKIIYNWINCLDNFNEIDIFTKNRISKTLMLYNRIQKLYNNKSMDYYGFCKFLFENQLYKLLENVLNKLLINGNKEIKSNLDYFTQIIYWTKLIHLYNINENNNDLWKYLLKIKKCYQFKIKQQEIKTWDISQIINYVNILIQLKHNQQAQIILNQILEKDQNHIEANKLLKQLKQNDDNDDNKEQQQQNDDDNDDVDENNNELYNFLSDANVDLLEYYDLFVDQGLNNLNNITNLTKTQLIQMDIKNAKHQTKILNAIENFKNKQLLNSPSIDLP